MTALVAIVPSARVDASAFLNILADNHILAQVRAWGSARVRTTAGPRVRVGGVAIAAIKPTDLERAKARSRLCGVLLAPLPRAVV